MKKFIIILGISFGAFSVNAQDTTDANYMNAYVVVADTSQNYVELRKKMFALSKKLQIEIDTMGRSFDKEKKLICLPEDADDEIYAGEYYPRRFPSETLSIEHLVYYQNEENFSVNLMALITTISRNKEVAEKNSNTAFIINTQIYVGCMH